MQPWQTRIDIVRECYVNGIDRLDSFSNERHGANPALTIMANALRVVERIVQG